MTQSMLIDLEPVSVDIDMMDEEIEKDLQVDFTLAIQTDVLKKAIGRVERTVAKKTVQDIYKTIYLEVQEQMLIFRAVNDNHMIEAVVTQNKEQTNFKLTSGKTGAACFAGDKLIPIIKTLKNVNTEIKVEAASSTIKSGRIKHNLQVFEAYQFPEVPQLSDGDTVTIDANLLSMLYDRTMYASSTRQERPILTGLHHAISGNEIRCVATDSHRLAQFVTTLSEEYEEMAVTVPVQTLNEVKKHLDTTEGNVTLELFSKHAVYSFDGLRIFSRLFEDKYPQVDRMIAPSEAAGTRFQVKVGEFQELLSGSTVCNPDQPIILRLKAEDNMLRVNTREIGVSAFQADLATKNGEGDDLIVGVNVRYLQDALTRYSNDDTVVFEFLPRKEDGTAPGMQPFQSKLLYGDTRCLELFLPVRSPEIDYDSSDVIIENFEGSLLSQYNPFEQDFDLIS